MRKVQTMLKSNVNVAPVMQMKIRTSRNDRNELRFATTRTSYRLIATLNTSILYYYLR